MGVSQLGKAEYIYSIWQVGYVPVEERKLKNKSQTGTPFIYIQKRGFLSGI